MKLVNDDQFAKKFSHQCCETTEDFPSDMPKLSSPFAEMISLKNFPHVHMQPGQRNIIVFKGTVVLNWFTLQVPFVSSALLHGAVILLESADWRYKVPFSLVLSAN